jgi:hypothetical protein
MSDCYADGNRTVTSFEEDSHGCAAQILVSGNRDGSGCGDTVAQGLLRWGLRCPAVLALMVAPVQTARPQEMPSVACIINADTGSVFDRRDIPGGGVLIRAERGLFLSLSHNTGTGRTDPIQNRDFDKPVIGPTLPSIGLRKLRRPRWMSRSG